MLVHSKCFVLSILYKKKLIQLESTLVKVLLVYTNSAYAKAKVLQNYKQFFLNVLISTSHNMGTKYTAQL